MYSIKEIAKSVIDTLLEHATMDDIIHTLYIRTKFDKGLKEIEEGKGIPHIWHQIYKDRRQH